MNLKDLHFLIIEPSSVLRAIIRNSLQTLGVPYNHILCAESKHEAQELLKDTTSIQFIIMSWNFPETPRSYDFIKIVRSKEPYRYILIVSLKGWKDDIQEAHDAGVDDVLYKPFTPQILEEKIKTIISTHLIKELV